MVINEASLKDQEYNYNKIQPTIFFWKEITSTKSHTPICLVPDTLILNAKDLETVWIYTNQQGRLVKDLNSTFKDFVGKLTNYSSPN